MEALSEVANGFADRWVQWLVAVSWQVAVVGVIVFLLARLLRRSPASFRYGLWLLVLVKLVLPPGLSTPWSLGTMLAEQVGPLEIRVERPDAADMRPGDIRPGDMRPALSGSRSSFLGPGNLAVHGSTLCLACVLLGGGGLLGTLVFRQRRFAHLALVAAHPARPETEALFQSWRKALGIRQSVELLVSPMATIPAAFGVWRPKVLIPDDLEARFSGGEVEQMLAHELGHIRRQDVLCSWLSALAVCLFWFHPVVWMAHFQLRREREMATDDLVLCRANTDAKSYSATILRVAEGYRDPVPAGVGMLGVLEASDDLLRRVRSIADAGRPRRTGYGWTVVLLAITLLLPMGVWGQEGGKDGDTVPRVAKTSPGIGAKDVNPATTELVLTFDQDMGKGCSWTGGGDRFPKTTGKPQWKDARTCVLPVELEPGKFYRVGINSKSHQNFKSVNGVPTPPGVLYFSTKGADATTLAMLKTPSVVKLNPAQGTKDVPASLTEISVSFDIPMGQGCSFTGSPESVPPGNGPIRWSEDGKTCTMPVTLQPGKQYQIGLNSPSHNNFQSAAGVPLAPVKWTFASTK